MIYLTVTHHNMLERFLILISKHNIDDIESTQLLHEIFAYLIDKPLYNQVSLLLNRRN